MKKQHAIFLVTILCVIFVALPLAVLVRASFLNSGWKGLVWGSTENQVNDWVLKNNNKMIWAKCKLSHFGVVCWRLSWKNKDDSAFEYIEFQFKDGKLVSVIETQKEKDFFDERAALGASERAFDVAVKEIREKGTKFIIKDRIEYFSPSQRYKGTKVRYALETLHKNSSKEDTPEEIQKYRLTTGYYSPSYYEEARQNTETFPSVHFLQN